MYIFKPWCLAACWLPVLAHAQPSTRGLDDTALPPALAQVAHSAVSAAVRQALPAAHRAQADIQVQLGAARGTARQPCEGAWHVTTPVITQLQRLHLPVRCGTATGSVVARVQLHAPTWVTRQTLAAGHTLQAHEVEVRPQALHTLDVLWPDMAVQGLQLRKALPTGSVLRARDVERPVLLRRGERVEIRAAADDAAGTIAVTVPGIAQGTGRLGEVVTVLNARTQRPVQGRVVAPGVLEAASEPLPDSRAVRVWQESSD